MDCIFIIQGEGRGHMAQALALADILRGAGHRVTAALVGRSGRRTLPDFFVRRIGVPVQQFDSPNFVTDARDRSVRMLPTFTHALRQAARYRESLRVIDGHIAGNRPDVIVNFFEPLAGIYNECHRPDAPMICVGHQYLVHHPAFPFPADQVVDQWALKRFADLSALRAARRLALSFHPLPDLLPRRLSIVPPLLRSEVFELAPTAGRSFLIYLLNSGYADEIRAWHRAHPDVELHCFWDHPGSPPTWRPHANLAFHQLDDAHFLFRMSTCRALVTTAGFESVCEAMYLGKPAMMVPVRGHFEQRCNALDAVRAGAGLTADRFDLDVLTAYLERPHPPRHEFRAWAQSAAPRFLAALEEAALVRRSARSRLVRHQRRRFESDTSEAADAIHLRERTRGSVNGRSPAALKRTQ